ncbi:uncharacterized protein OCT59_025606 [Rhizophagus irregularis]|uniref:uncharacterized protein n=1 Tax=Rhizophagus irregularis TaxID=588596 RepID=UPI0019D9DFBD|nr:hypothetical protein OCT59_025606 [Rhizophagus irregularis]GBC11252.2 hypothetical protein GLOIN_2v1695973 [Rhizophagus irregularis DAOM 181602=DAOM 197198]
MINNTFSYLNATIYGVNINANLDMRIENIQASSGVAKVYFTDSALPLNTSNPIPPPPQLTIVDSRGNNLKPIVINGITCFGIIESRGYTFRLNGQVFFTLGTHIQQCTIVAPSMTHFTIQF